MLKDYKKTQYIISVPFGLIFVLCSVMLMQQPGSVGLFALAELTFFLISNLIDALLLISKWYAKISTRLLNRLIRQNFFRGNAESRYRKFAIL